MPRRAAKVPTEATQQVSVVVSRALVERADTLIPVVSGQMGKNALRSDVWRVALLAGLRELERQRDKQEG
jgi:hypothetical protein